VPYTPAPSNASMCTGSVTLPPPAGTFTEGPGEYVGNANCQWQLSSTAPITLSFSSFATEANYDFVRVYDGLLTSSPILAILSGASATPVTGTTNDMLVVFTSDATVNAQGFVALYSTAGISSTDNSSASDALCASFLTATSATTGTLTNGPLNYGNALYCEWRIDIGTAVQLTFQSFDVENNYDFLKVYDGNLQQLQGTYTGSVLPVPVTSAGEMIVVFTSDSSISSSGFAASYSAAPAAGR